MSTFLNGAQKYFKLADTFDSAAPLLSYFGAHDASLMRRHGQRASCYTCTPCYT